MLKRILFLFFVISFLFLLLVFNFSIGFDSSNYNASFVYNYDTRTLYVNQIDNPSSTVLLPPIPEGFKHYILTYPQDNHYWYIIVCDDPIMVDVSGRYVSSGTNNLSVYSARTGFSEWTKLKNFQFELKLKNIHSLVLMLILGILLQIILIKLINFLIK